MAARQTEDKPLEVALVPEDHGVGADNPENREATGQVTTASETIVGTEVPIVRDPTQEGTKRDLEENRRVKVLRREETAPEENRRTRLPDSAYESAAFKAANNAARDSFANVVRRPGDKFVDHGGRYVNIEDLNEVYDVEPNSVVPDGLFLFPTNYLVRDLDEVRGR